MIENMLAAVELLGVSFGIACFITGAALWLRWGWTGVALIWKRRLDIDDSVKRELESMFRDPRGRHE